MTLLRNKFLLLLLCLLTVCPARAGLFGIAPKDRQEFVQARSLYEQGQYEQAVTALSAYIYKTEKIKRREARAYRLLGLSYEQLNKPGKALETYLEALEFHHKNIPLLLAAAALYQRTQLLDRSIDLYNRVLELESDNTEALAGQAVNYLRMGFYSKSRQYFDRFFALNPQAPANYRAGYAYAFFKQRDFENAFINITMAKTEDMANPAYWLLSAQAYKELGQMEEALADLDIAAQLTPQNENLRVIKTMWLYQYGDKAASLQAARELLKENPQNELALFMVYMNLKDDKPKEARKALQQIKAQGNDSFARRVAEKILGK